MRVIFFGIFGVGVLALERLVEQRVNVVGVVTKPDIRGARQPVVEIAKRIHCPLFQPEKVTSPALFQDLDALAPDLIVVAGFHQRIPPSLLALPLKGAINLHLSLLPTYRGPVPHKWVIIIGESVTGATVHMMTERFDDGDIIGQSRLTIACDETADSLFSRLCTLGADLLVDSVRKFQDGSITAEPQDEWVASYHPNFTDADMTLDWRMDACAIERRVRGLTNRPGAWFFLDHRRVRVERASILDRCSGEEPGRILDRDEHVVTVATGSLDMKIDYQTTNDKGADDQDIDRSGALVVLASRIQADRSLPGGLPKDIPQTGKCDSSHKVAEKLERPLPSSPFKGPGAFAIDHRHGYGSKVILAESSEWDDVLLGMSAASTYHGRWYNQLSAQQIRGDAVLFTHQEGPYHAALPLIFYSGEGRGHRRATSAYGYPGPLANTRNLPTSFTASFKTGLQTLLVSEDAERSCSRLNPFGTALPLLDKMGTVKHVGDTVTIDLDASNEDRFRCYRRNHRNDISKMRKMSSRTFEDRNFEYIDRFIELYLSTMKRVHADERYFFDKEYFHFMADHFDDEITFLMSEIEGDILAGGLFFCSHKIAYAHLVGSTPSMSCRSPTKLLFDDACRFFKERDYKSLFLGGGVGARQDSLFYFKCGFSDNIVPFNVWEWSR